MPSMTIPILALALPASGSWKVSVSEMWISLSLNRFSASRFKAEEILVITVTFEIGQLEMIVRQRKGMAPKKVRQKIMYTRETHIGKYAKAHLTAVHHAL
uniref:Uncharacterized protein n=1 Tax=Candidatus Kentrum sp. FW TaxID=2126338 RepID=A0A450TBP9_9GAMM|nr:MAG: hypothetical protein BECKFW1821C_GA0114237_100549 [Candidatus Kentron sp. FW]